MSSLTFQKYNNQTQNTCLPFWLNNWSTEEQPNYFCALHKKFININLIISEELKPIQKNV